jgi:hypothetical protein
VTVTGRAHTPDGTNPAYRTLVQTITITPKGTTGATVQVLVSWDAEVDVEMGDYMVLESYFEAAIAKNGDWSTKRDVWWRKVTETSLTRARAVGSASFTMSVGDTATFGLYARKWITQDQFVVRPGAMLKAQIIA